jgi:hypothetical protein
MESVQSLNEKQLMEMSATKGAQRNINDNTSCSTKRKGPNFFVDTQGRAISLKEVLTNLHEDFSSLKR